MVQDSFLDDRAKRLNNDVRLDFRFDTIKLRPSSRNEDDSHESI